MTWNSFSSAVFLGLLFAPSTPTIAQTYSMIEKYREIQNKTKEKCDVYRRFALAEKEAIENGRPDAAQLYRQEKEKALAECQEMKAKEEASKTAIANAKRHQETEERN